jgi:hypothetical protein
MGIPTGVRPGDAWNEDELRIAARAYFDLLVPELDGVKLV